MKRKLNNLKRHFRRWNAWRKRNANCKFHQILVLLKLANSPTFEMFLLPEELPNYKTIFHGPEMLNNDAYEATKALCASLDFMGERSDGMLNECETEE